MRMPPVPEPHVDITPSDIPPEVDEPSLERVLLWVDGVPLSRPKRHLRRDFSDGVLVAEIIKYFLPKFVDIHNYSMTNAVKAKEENWDHLNRKVLSRLGVTLTPTVTLDLCLSRPGVAEHVLAVLRERINVVMATGHRGNQRLDPELVRWMKKPTNQATAGEDGGTQKREFQTLEQFYLSKGLKIFPEQPEDQIINSSRLGPHQKKSILKLTEMVPREELEARTRAAKEKHGVIQALYDKIRRLEHLLEIKDIRINDLSNRLEALEDPQHLRVDAPPAWLSSTPSPGKHSPRKNNPSSPRKQLQFASPRRPTADMSSPRRRAPTPHNPPDHFDFAELSQELSSPRKSISLTSGESVQILAPPSLTRRPMAALASQG